MASFVDYQQNPLFINILPLFWFTIILLIQCFKAFSNTLGWKDPGSRKRGPKYGGEGTTLTLCGLFAFIREKCVLLICDTFGVLWRNPAK